LVVSFSDKLQVSVLTVKTRNSTTFRFIKYNSTSDSLYFYPMSAITISEKFKKFSEHWTPKKIGELNGQQVLLAKLKGEFIWHTHDNEDELFLIQKGSLKIEFENKTVTLNEGDMYIIPKGVSHKPIAEEEVHVLLFEPMSTKHTGSTVSDRTVTNYESI